MEVLILIGTCTDEDCKPMSQPYPDYTMEDLLVFYDRVKPFLAEWFAKPVWTARETAMLCAGYVPDSPEIDDAIPNYQQESIHNSVPIDPQRYIPPNQELYSEYLGLLKGKEAAPPCDMVQLLAPTSRATSLMPIGVNREMYPVVYKRVFSLTVLKERQWFFIIGNAVGLPVPTFVPFGLLDKLSDRLTVASISDSASEQGKKQPDESVPGLEIEEGTQPVIAVHICDAKPNATPRKIRERRPLQTTPEKRGYHTTEEVAGLTNLAPGTLNKYAREAVHVEGFTPFKRQNGRAWQWRSDQQQAAYKASANETNGKRGIK